MKRYPGCTFASPADLAKHIAYTAILDLLVKDTAEQAARERDMDEGVITDRSSTWGKAIVGLVIYGIFLLVDIVEIFHWNHLLGVVAGIAGTVAMLCLEAFVLGAISSYWWKIASVIVAIGGVFIYFESGPIVLPTLSITGELIAGSIPVAPDACDKMGKKIPPNYMNILIADSVYARPSIGANAFGRKNARSKRREG